MAAPGPDTWRRVGGWTLAALALAFLASVPLSLSGGVMARPGVVAEGPDLWIAFFVPGFALSGGLLVHLRPRNPIGWLLVLSGLLQVTNLAADAYATRALTDPDGSLPLGLASAWLASWTWMPSLLLPTLVLPALYPTGRAPGAYWTWHVRLALLGIGLAAVAMATGPGGVDDTVAGTEMPWTAPVWSSYVLGVPAFLLVVGTMVSVTVGTLVRAIRAVSPERQQLLWLLSVVAVLLITVWTGPELLFVVSYTFIPVAITIGVLRYRLLGIVIVLRRTLLYVPLTLLVALVVGVLTTVVARGTPDGPVPLLVSSAVVAVLVIPVAGRLRVLVDRFVLGGPTDPLAAVDRVGAGLEVEHDDPVAAMLEAVSSAVGASYAAVRDRDDRLLAETGAPRPVRRRPVRWSSRCGTAEPASGPCPSGPAPDRRTSPPRMPGSPPRWHPSWPWCCARSCSPGSSPASGPASRRPRRASGTGCGATCTTVSGRRCPGSRSACRRPRGRWPVTPRPWHPCSSAPAPSPRPRSGRSGASWTGCDPAPSTSTSCRWPCATPPRRWVSVVQGERRSSSTPTTSRRWHRGSRRPPTASWRSR